MSDLPKRIWVEPANRSEGGNYGMWTLKSNKKSTEYLRADLLPGREDLCTAIAEWIMTADDKPTPSFIDDLADAILERIGGAS